MTGPKDYLGLLRSDPSKAELLHKEFDESKVKRDGNGQFAKKNARDQKELEQLRAKQNKELEDLFGPEILTMSAQEFMDSRPPGEKGDIAAQLSRVLNRQIDEQQSLIRQQHAPVPQKAEAVQQASNATLDPLFHDDIEHAKSYMAAIMAKPGEDALQYGVKGMKWGVRKADSSSSSKGGPTKLPPRSHEPPDGKGGPTKLPPRSHNPPVKIEEGPGKVPDGPRKQSAAEPSAERYARLREQARLGKAHLMSEDDLKFFNARTEALAKINKLYQQDPSWISKTSKKVVQNVAEKAIQDVANHVATKYITVPVTKAIGETKK